MLSIIRQNLRQIVECFKPREIPKCTIQMFPKGNPDISFSPEETNSEDAYGRRVYVVHQGSCEGLLD